MPLSTFVRVLRPVASLAAILALAACTAEADDDDSAASATTAPNLTRAKIDEVSRFRHRGRALRTLDASRVQSFRVNGFGGTKVRIEVVPKDGAFVPMVTLAGPIPGDDTKVVAHKRGTRAAGTVIETTLDARGAYRILVGTQASFDGRRGEAGNFDLRFECLEKCDQPEVSLGGLLGDLKASLGESQLRAGLTQAVTARIDEPELRSKILDSVLSLVADPSRADALAVPSVPMSLAGAAAGLFELAPPREDAVPPAGPKTFDLATLGASCTVKRADPSAAREILPGLRMADAPDYTYDDCALARLEGLAEAFNALSMEDGSTVVDGELRYTTVTELVDGLYLGGHRIQVDNARYYADFLGLSYEGASVRAPVWLDTEIPLTGGDTLKIPAPHAHHNIYVSGPRFDGQLKFYMGVDAGTSFRVQSSIPRAWSGGRSIYTLDTELSPQEIDAAFYVAGRLRKKWQTAGASMPLTGYGRLGVCTDSTAVLEHALQRTVTLFPLAHPAAPATGGDDVDAILRALPSDLDGFDAADAIARIEKTIPFDAVSAVPFPAFRDAWARVPR